MNPLVSIITPCYNGENFVGRFLDSVLSQTYDNIELIIINDGSIDKTEKIIQSYKSKFENKGYTLIYIYQENSGQSAAINQGLKLFRGEFLVWADSDDSFPPHTIEERVRFMVLNPRYGTVFTTTEIINNETGEILNFKGRSKEKEEENLFFNHIKGIEYYPCGAYMVRSLMFRECMPSPLQIICPREVGQNYQMLLPILYTYPYFFLDITGYHYYIRYDSHSHESHEFDEKMKIFSVGEKVLIHICNNIKMKPSDRGYALELIHKRYIKSRINTLLDYGTKAYLSLIKDDITKYSIKDKDLRKSIYFIEHPDIFKIYKFISRIKCRILRCFYGE